MTPQRTKVPIRISGCKDSPASPRHPSGRHAPGASGLRLTKIDWGDAYHPGPFVVTSFTFSLSGFTNGFFTLPPAWTCRAQTGVTTWPGPCGPTDRLDRETPWLFMKSDPTALRPLRSTMPRGKDRRSAHRERHRHLYQPGQRRRRWSTFGGNVWYRKHFTLDNSYSGRKVFVEFQGVHIGCQVYINGTFLPGNSAVTADATATHLS